MQLSPALHATMALLFTRRIFQIGVIAMLLLLSYSCQAQPMSMFERNSLDRAERANFLAYQKAKNEGANLRRWWKGEGTIGIAFSGPLNYTHRTRYDENPDPTEWFDSTIAGTAKPQLSFAVNGNSNHLITRLGASDILSISVGEQVNFMRWTFDAWSGSTRKADATKLIYVQLGIPVTLDYKWGCDVDFDPEQKSCFAIGVGGMPMYSMSLSNLEPAGSSFRIAPYAYASFGFYMRGCWKLRLSYLPGKYTVSKDALENVGGTINTLNIQGSNIITLGISHMSYSKDWGNGSAVRGREGNSSSHHSFFGGRRRHVSEGSRMF